MNLRKLIGLGGLAGIALATVLGLSPASAHNALVSANPAAGSVVTEQPGTFAITTSDVLLDSGTDSPTTFLQVRGPDASELYYGDGCATVDGASLTMPVQLGEPGAYTVFWGVVSTDGHPITGDYTFTWQPAEGQELSDGLAQPPSCGGTPAASEEPAPSAAAPVAPTESASTTPATGADETSTAAADILWIGVALGVLVVAAVLVLVVVRWRSRRAAPEAGEQDTPVV